MWMPILMSSHAGSTGRAPGTARVNRGRWPNTSTRVRRQVCCKSSCAGTPDQPGVPLERPGSTEADPQAPHAMRSNEHQQPINRGVTGESAFVPHPPNLPPGTILRGGYLLVTTCICSSLRLCICFCISICTCIWIRPRWCICFCISVAICICMCTRLRWSTSLCSTRVNGIHGVERGQLDTFGNRDPSI